MSFESLFVACLRFLTSLIIICTRVLRLKISWLVYSLVLVYVGGIIVLFLYMCSLETKVNIQEKTILGLFLIVFVFRSFMGLINYSEKNIFAVDSLSLFRTYLPSNRAILVTIILYLIIGLFLRVLLCRKLEGPLKSVSHD